MKKYLWMSSAAVVTGDLRAKNFLVQFLQDYNIMFCMGKKKS